MRPMTAEGSGSWGGVGGGVTPACSLIAGRPALVYLKAPHGLDTINSLTAGMVPTSKFWFT